MVCQVLSNNIAIFVQCGLGLCALGGLVLKRIIETPKRVFAVFLRDVSKQIIGSLFAHQLNLLISIQMTSGVDKESSDQCMWYFMNYLVDVLLGVFLNWGLVICLNRMANRYSWKNLQSGEYIADNRMLNRSYMLQLGSWLGIIMSCKLILWGVILIPLHGPLGGMGGYILKSVSNHPTLELVIVMILVPLFLNLLQFWIQDDFLQRSHSDPDLADTETERTPYASIDVTQTEQTLDTSGEYMGYVDL
jgi:hypothetical protein